jgi:Domain of unknown function (DUF4386)
MAQRTTEASQRIAARVAGFTLLLLIASGVLGIFVFQRGIIVSADAAATARNLLAHERSFRVGIACGIVMLNCDIVLALALYALLKPVNATLALLGAFWRVANAILLGVGVSATLVALRLLGGGAPCLVSFKADQLHALAMLFLGIPSATSTMGLLFFCLGAATHSYLLFQSRYIPRILSAAYLVVALQLLAGCFALIIFPSVARWMGLGYIAPDFIVELSVALWLAFKGAAIPYPPQPQNLSTPPYP